jgi:hypothetical protein
MRQTLAATVATLLLAGCTFSGNSAHHPTNHPGPPTAAVHTTAAGALPSGVVGATKVPARVPNSARLRADVVLSTCSAHTGGWEAAGAVRNPDRRSTRKYVITVFFTTNRATVIGTAATTVAVPPAKSRPWSLSAKFHAATPTLCVLRGVGPADHPTKA